MTSKVNYKIVRECKRRQHDSDRYNPASVLKMQWKNKKVLCVLGCGTSDDIHVFREGTDLLVLTVNERHGYMGLEIFMLNMLFESDYVDNAYEPSSDEIFLQSSEQIEDLFECDPFEKCTRMTMAKTLYNNILWG